MCFSHVLIHSLCCWCLQHLGVQISLALLAAGLWMSLALPSRSRTVGNEVTRHQSAGHLESGIHRAFSFPPDGIGSNVAPDVYHHYIKNQQVQYSASWRSGFVLPLKLTCLKVHVWKSVFRVCLRLVFVAFIEAWLKPNICSQYCGSCWLCANECWWNEGPTLWSHNVEISCKQTCFSFALRSSP